jgi:hypothetical protein
LGIGQGKIVKRSRRHLVIAFVLGALCMALLTAGRGVRSDEDGIWEVTWYAPDGEMVLYESMDSRLWQGAGGSICLVSADSGQTVCLTGAMAIERAGLMQRRNEF